jgi:hypothetical protein
MIEAKLLVWPIEFPGYLSDALQVSLLVADKVIP